METMPTAKSQTRAFTTIFLIEMWERHLCQCAAQHYRSARVATDLHQPVQQTGRCRPGLHRDRHCSAAADEPFVESPPRAGDIKAIKGPVLLSLCCFKHDEFTIRRNRKAITKQAFKAVGITKMPVSNHP